jgi:ribosomal protein S18 acetylase RimI-like enzyme
MIPYGPVPRLGHGFMQNTYYKVLPSSGWLKCEAYSQGGKVAGFFSSAQEEGSLMKALGLFNFFKLGIGILKAVACAPRRFLVVLELLRRSPPKNRIGGVELLSFGVDPSFRDYLDPLTGKRLSLVLFENCMKAWKARGMKTVFCRVKRDNLPVLLFYKNYGAKICSHAEDPTSFEIEFDLSVWGLGRATTK